jgi:hydroxymethylglutaryl-CoA lyase
LDNRIEIIDVAPRDGLQSQPEIVDTAIKLELIQHLINAGIRRMEVASFVNPKRVPQMADVDELTRNLPQREDVTFIGLVLNMRGFERAMQSGIDEINCIAVASDTFSQRNQGVPINENMQTIAEICRQAKTENFPCTVTIAVSFGCPFEGEVPVERVAQMSKQLADMGFKEIALADTIGAAGPSDVVHRIRAVKEAIGDAVKLRCHFHDTRNTGVANAYAAIMAGVRILDASCGGVGGCPFAPAATGNVATEDILYMIQRMGLQTGVDIEAIMACARWLEGPLQAKMPAMLTRAGVFPVIAVEE